MTILEAENQTLRKRVRELEAALRLLKETHTRIVSENEDLKNRLHTLETPVVTGIEARVYPRIEVSFLVDVVNHRGEVSMGMGRNVSLGGAFIETALPTTTGELLTVVFTLGNQPFKFQAEVRRVGETGFGVKFLLDATQQARLRDALSRL